MIDEVPFDTIDVSVLERLRDNQIAESRTIDYKRDDPTKNPDSFLANVTSFANTIGGYLLYGVDADKETAVPTAFPGLKVDAPDKFLLTLNHLIHDRTDPSLAPPDYRWVEVADGRRV